MANEFVGLTATDGVLLLSDLDWALVSASRFSAAGRPLTSTAGSTEFAHRDDQGETFTT